MDQHAIDGVGNGPGPTPRPQRKCRRQRRSAERRIFEAVEAAFDVKRGDLRTPTRGRGEIALARQTGMYLARVALGMTLSEAGDLFGRDRTTAAHACRLVEDLRDDTRFDAVLSIMETHILRSDACHRDAAR